MNSNEKIIYVVDDDLAVRTALTRSLETRQYHVKSYESAEAFLMDIGNVTESPSCLILDVRMPGLSGLELQEQLKQEHPALPIIFITGHGDIPMSVRAIKDGAFEFLEKPYRVEELLEHIEKALTRNVELHKQQQHTVILLERLERLTVRERDVLNLLVAGIANHSNKEIARQLNISHRTVDDHRARIMAKMQARSLAELVDMSKICGVYNP